MYNCIAKKPKTIPFRCHFPWLFLHRLELVFCKLYGSFEMNTKCGNCSVQLGNAMVVTYSMHACLHTQAVVVKLCNLGHYSGIP